MHDPAVVAESNDDDEHRKNRDGERARWQN
jgi:hypothetical protein